VTSELLTDLKTPNKLTMVTKMTTGVE